MFCTSGSELSQVRANLAITPRHTMSDVTMNRASSSENFSGLGVFGSPLISQGAAWAKVIQSSRSFHGMAGRLALLAEVKSFSALQDDWDGEGGVPVSAHAVAAAIQFIELMEGTMALPLAYPNPNGTVTLAWRWRVGRAELEIGKTRHSWIVVDRSTGETRRTSCSGDNARVPKLGQSDLASAIAVSVSAEPVTTVGVSMRHVWEEAA